MASLCSLPEWKYKTPSGFRRSLAQNTLTTPQSQSSDGLEGPRPVDLLTVAPPPPPWVLFAAPEPWRRAPPAEPSPPDNPHAQLPSPSLRSRLECPFLSGDPCLCCPIFYPPSHHGPQMYSAIYHAHYSVPPCLALPGCPTVCRLQRPGPLFSSKDPENCVAQSRH